MSFLCGSTITSAISGLEFLPFVKDAAVFEHKGFSIRKWSSMGVFQVFQRFFSRWKLAYIFISEDKEVHCLLFITVPTAYKVFSCVEQVSA